MSKFNVEKKEYVKLLNMALEPLTDFGSVCYLDEYSTGAEYIKYVDAMGSAKFLNVTSQDKERILLEVISLVAGNKTPNIVEDNVQKRAIARLFVEREK